MAATRQGSIISPVRNDAEALVRTLNDLDRLPGRDTGEVIVAAAGDRQETERVVGECARLLWPDGSTRALPMNTGAVRAGVRYFSRYMRPPSLRLKGCH